MNFSIKRGLTDQVFSTQIICDTFGDGALTAAEEQSLIEDFGPVVVDIGGKFEGKYKVDPGTGDVLEDATLLDNTISFIVSNNKFDIKKGTIIPFEIDAKKISKEELALHVADTFKDSPLKIAEAKCIIFEKVATEKIKEVLLKFKTNKTGFESNTPSNFQA